MIHDLMIPDENPFTFHTRSRALTQVSQRVRAEFLRIWRQTATIGVHIEDLETYIETWIQGSSPTGTIILGFNGIIQDRGPRLAPGTFTKSLGNITVDLTPLVKLHRESPAFRFYFVDNVNIIVNPKTEDKHIDDSIDRIEINMRRWSIQPLLFCFKPGFKRTLYVEEQYVSPLEMGPLEDWLGKIWSDDYQEFEYTGYDVVAAE
jgi:hypothetical protein